MIGSSPVSGPDSPVASPRRAGSAGAVSEHGAGQDLPLLGLFYSGEGPVSITRCVIAFSCPLPLVRYRWPRGGGHLPWPTRPPFGTCERHLVWQPRLMQLRERRLTRDGGRVVAWTECGSPSGRPVLRIPGTPGSRIPLRPDATPWTRRGLRMITTERPGFGASSRLPDHGFLEHADDLAVILDNLSIEALPAIGGSGGAPYLLAFMAAHPHPPQRRVPPAGLGWRHPRIAPTSFRSA